MITEDNKFVDYGKKSLTPLVNLIGRYKSDITPYSQAVLRGLDGAITALGVSEDEESAQVAGWCRDAREWFSSASEELQNGDSKDLLNYFQKEAEKNPGLMFSASYAMGLIFGRVGRYWKHDREDSIH